MARVGPWVTGGPLFVRLGAMDACTLPDPSSAPPLVVAIDERSGTVWVAAGEDLVRFVLHPFGPADPGCPGRVGWTADAPDVPGAERPVGVSHVLNATGRTPESEAAVVRLSVWASAEALWCARDLSGMSHCDRSTAERWRRGAERLQDSVRKARELRRVPARPLRDAYIEWCERTGHGPSELADRLGWHWSVTDGGAPKADSTRVLKRLGLAPEGGVRHRARMTSDGTPQDELRVRLARLGQTVSYATAVALCAALERDPADFGWV